MRTRNTLQSLDISRRTILLQNLIQANLLRKEWKGQLSMLYQANVSGIQFDQLFIHHVSDCPDIQHADMRHASFRAMSFSHSPSFAFSNLDYSDWSFSKLDKFDFDLTITLNNVRFTGSQLESVSFEAIPMNKVSFQYINNCSGCIFLNTSLLDARFDHGRFIKSMFAFSSITDGNMSSSYFVESEFHGVNLDGVDFGYTNFQRCLFYQVSMRNCSMLGMQLQNSSLSHVDLTGCIDFDPEQIHSWVKIDQVTLPNGTTLHSCV
ncbi:unnamed protein product [Adineta ricciae]|uniref:Pentapeptide repeat-containing protein n=1 Tax=Adineta ricciae TaxID=249248 RepID=A0A815GW50_ADIRI|nr:unnamed protein product [Adineta ricciae]